MAGKLSFEKFMESRYSFVLIIAFTLVISNLLLYLMILYQICVMQLLIPALIVAAPYFLGEKRVKQIAVYGTVVLIALGITMTGILAYSTQNHTVPFDRDLVSDREIVYLRDGTVEPFRGNTGTSFNFSVEYVGGRTPTNVTVSLFGFNNALHNLSLDKNAGNVFYNDSITLDSDVYNYMFFVSEDNGTSWQHTDMGDGPVTMTYGEYFKATILVRTFYIFASMGLMFYMFVMMLWWTRKARKERMKLYGETPEEVKLFKDDKGKKSEWEEEEEKEEEECEFTCTSCGADVKGDADKCPKCGEEFEGEVEEETMEEQGKTEEEDAPGTCAVCDESIEKGDTVLQCRCGKTFHMGCVKGKDCCPQCENEW